MIRKIFGKIASVFQRKPIDSIGFIFVNEFEQLEPYSFGATDAEKEAISFLKAEGFKPTDAQLTLFWGDVAAYNCNGEDIVISFPKKYKGDKEIPDLVFTTGDNEGIKMNFQEFKQYIVGKKNAPAPGSTGDEKKAGLSPG